MDHEVLFRDWTWKSLLQVYLHNSGPWCDSCDEVQVSKMQLYLYSGLISSSPMSPFVKYQWLTKDRLLLSILRCAWTGIATSSRSAFTRQFSSVCLQCCRDDVVFSLSTKDKHVTLNMRSRSRVGKGKHFMQHPNFTYLHELWSLQQVSARSTHIVAWNAGPSICKKGQF